MNGFVKFPLAWNSDDVTAFEAATNNGIVHINEILFYYRTNPYNISTTGNWMLKAEAMLQKEKWIENKISKIAKTNKQECIICQLIQQKLPSQMHSKLLQELSNGVKGHKIHNLFLYLRNIGSLLENQFIYSLFVYSNDSLLHNLYSFHFIINFRFRSD